MKFIAEQTYSRCSLCHSEPLRGHMGSPQADKLQRMAI